jgi:hypothetical protein
MPESAAVAVEVWQLLCEARRRATRPSDRFEHRRPLCRGIAALFALAGKAVLEVEYNLGTSQFRPDANAANEDAMAMIVNPIGGP